MAKSVAMSWAVMKSVAMSWVAMSWVVAKSVAMSWVAMSWVVAKSVAMSWVVMKLVAKKLASQKVSKYWELTWVERNLEYWLALMKR